MCCPAELRGADRHADACADHPAGDRDGTTGVLMGGPMMGMPMPNLDVPVVKATNCILVQSAELFPPLPQALPCIRCTRCADVCPAELQPQELFRFAKAGDFGRAQEYHLFDCIECGCCSYVCPSHIPLVDFYRYAKGEIWTREKDKRAADLARERHAFRQFRQEREKKKKARSLPPRPRPSAPSLPPRPTPAAPRPAKPMQESADRCRACPRAGKKAETAPKNTDHLSPEPSTRSRKSRRAGLKSASWRTSRWSPERNPKASRKKTNNALPFHS